MNLHRSENPKSDIEEIVKDITQLGAQVSTIIVTKDRLSKISSKISGRLYKNGSLLLYSESTGLIYAVGLISGDRIYIWYWNMEVGNELGGVGNTKYIPVAISPRYLSMLQVASELKNKNDLSDEEILSVAGKYSELPLTISGLLMSKVIVLTEQGYKVHPKYIFERKIDSFTKYVTVDGLQNITDRKSIKLEDIEYSKEDIILYTQIGNKKVKVVIENGFKAMPTPLVVKETVEKFYKLK